MITAIYDQHDSLKPVFPQEEYEIDWVFVTDNPPDNPMGWRIVHDPCAGTEPRKAAKFPKIIPWAYTDAEASIWVDGSFRITSPRFVFEAMSHANPIAQFVHPWRDCLYKEATRVRYDASRYRELGHPENWGLWATGVIAREHTEDVKDLGDLWCKEVDRGSLRDQVSQPYALRSVGLRPNPFPGDYFSSSWLRYEGSGRH